MVSEERLKNWAFYCAWGHLGPEVRTRAASAEGNYESEDVFEGEEPRIEPDMIDGEIIELTADSLMNKLFCTFSSKDGLDDTLREINREYTILYKKIFVLASPESEEYMCTYNRRTYGS